MGKIDFHISKIKIYSLCLWAFLWFAGPSQGLADEWLHPASFEDFSQNGKYVAHVTPAKGDIKSRLSVYTVKNEQRQILWEAELSNPVSPVEVRVSDNGLSVITFDNWHRVGFGEDTLVIYNGPRLVKKYSLEEIFQRPKGKDELGDLEYFLEKIRYSASSRWWRDDCLDLFDDQAPIFAIWVEWDSRWLALDLGNGAIITIKDEMAERWRKKCHELARDRIKLNKAKIADYKFLGVLRDPDDRQLLLNSLKSIDFSQEHIVSYSGNTISSWSRHRLTVDQILSQWQAKKIDYNSDSEHYNILGSLKLKVTYPIDSKKEIGFLYIYLEQKNTGNSEPPLPKIEAYLRADLSTYHQNETEYVYYLLKNISPGRYEVFALWDCNPPYNSLTPPFMASQGDFITADPPGVEIEAGKTTTITNLSCLKTVNE